MMTADKSLFLWNKGDSWWDYDEKGDIVLTDRAPQEARKSFERYKKSLNRRNESCIDE